MKLIDAAQTAMEEFLADQATRITDWSALTDAERLEENNKYTALKIEIEKAKIKETNFIYERDRAKQLLVASHDSDAQALDILWQAKYDNGMDVNFVPSISTAS